MDANSSATVDILVTPKALGDIPNTVTVDANESDPISVAFLTTVTCASPPGGHYFVKPTNIVDGTSCGPYTYIGLLRSWPDEAENLFEMWCTVGLEGLQYQLWYTNEPEPVGKCIWVGGLNYGEIEYPGNTDGDGAVNCFLQSFWMSIEPVKVDPKDCSPGCQGDDCQGMCNIVDFKTWNFVVPHGGISGNAPQLPQVVAKHFVSLDGPGGVEPDLLVESGQDANFGFDQLSPADDLDMKAYEFELCDNDKDGDCDPDDIEQFRAVMGQCEHGDNFNVLADANHDGCATINDLHLLFPGQIIYLPSVLK